MAGILLPMNRFATTGDDDAGAQVTILGGHGRSGVHGESNRADDALGMVHEADELTQVGLADEIDDAIEWRMPVTCFTALDKLDSTFEVIYDGLVVLGWPPFSRKVVLAASNYDPERTRVTEFLDLACPASFLIREVDVALEVGERDAEAEFALEVFVECLDEVDRTLIAVVDRRVLCLDDLAVLVVIAGGADNANMRVVFPDRIRGRVNLDGEAVAVCSK